MREIKFANRFKKEFKLMRKRGKDSEKFDEVMKLLECGNILPESFKDHKLQGEFKNFRECHIDPDWLLVYSVMKNQVIFERTGTHSDLFK
jgi:mRNA interferase YafQ